MFYSLDNLHALNKETKDATLSCLILWALDKTIDIWDLSYYRGNASDCDDPLDKWSHQIVWNCLNRIVQREGYAWPCHEVAQIVRAVIWYYKGNNPYDTGAYMVVRRNDKMGFACKKCGEWFQYVGTYTHMKCLDRKRKF